MTTPLTPGQKAAKTRRENERKRQDAANEAAAVEAHKRLRAGEPILYGDYVGMKLGEFECKTIGYHFADGTAVSLQAVRRLLNTHRAKQERNKIWLSSPAEHEAAAQRRRDEDAANESAWLTYWVNRFNAAAGDDLKRKIACELISWATAHSLTDEFSPDPVPVEFSP